MVGRQGIPHLKALYLQDARHTGGHPQFPGCTAVLEFDDTVPMAVDDRIREIQASLSAGSPFSMVVQRLNNDFTFGISPDPALSATEITRFTDGLRQMARDSGLLETRGRDTWRAPSVRDLQGVSLEGVTTRDASREI